MAENKPRYPGGQYYAALGTSTRPAMTHHKSSSSHLTNAPSSACKTFFTSGGNDQLGKLCISESMWVVIVADGVGCRRYTRLHAAVSSDGVPHEWLSDTACPGYVQHTCIGQHTFCSATAPPATTCPPWRLALQTGFMPH